MLTRRTRPRFRRVSIWNQPPLIVALTNGFLLLVKHRVVLL